MLRLPPIARFEYEMTSGRTLSHTGENISLMVQSVTSVTHSYTVQVHILLADKLGTYLYICFQESKDEFGPKITEILAGKPPFNIVVDASTSGKLIKNHVKRAAQCIQS